MNLTEEQKDIVSCIKQGKPGIYAVNAVSGSGKSSTAKAIVEECRPSNGFYTAFNKGIVNDTNKKMGNLIPCKTIHALAYKYYRPTMELKGLTYDDITEDYPLGVKQEIIDTLDRYHKSNWDNIDDFLAEELDGPVNYEFEAAVSKYDRLMTSGKVNPSFNYMLKWLHKKLINERVKIDFDMFIIDETQDVGKVTSEIFKKINAKQKIILGDRYQNIYSSFLDTVNMFEIVDADQIFPLTKSFRCNPDIAQQVQTYGEKYLNHNFRFVGTEQEENDNTVAYLTKSNASMIMIMSDLIEAGERFSLIRKPNEIFEFIFAIIYSNQIDKEFIYNKYNFLRDEYIKLHGKRKISQTKWLSELANDIFPDNQNVTETIKTIIKLRTKGINVFDLKKKVSEMKPNPNIILSTTHSFKGLEANTVYMYNDLDSALARSIDNVMEGVDDELDTEMFNLYYVAMTRAKNNLLKYEN